MLDNIFSIGKDKYSLELYNPFVERLMILGIFALQFFLPADRIEVVENYGMPAVFFAIVAGLICILSSINTTKTPEIICIIISPITFYAWQNAIWGSMKAINEEGWGLLALIVLGAAAVAGFFMFAIPFIDNMVWVGAVYFVFGIALGIEAGFQNIKGGHSVRFSGYIYIALCVAAFIALIYFLIVNMKNITKSSIAMCVAMFGIGLVPLIIAGILKLFIPTYIIALGMIGLYAVVASIVYTVVKDKYAGTAFLLAPLFVLALLYEIHNIEGKYALPIPVIPVVTKALNTPAWNFIFNNTIGPIIDGYRSIVTWIIVKLILIFKSDMPESVVVKHVLAPEFFGTLITLLLMPVSSSVGIELLGKSHGKSKKKGNGAQGNGNTP